MGLARGWMRRTISVGVVAGILLAGSTAFAEASVSPHGVSTACAVCHGEDASAPAVAPASDAACERCHVGEEPHAVDVVPENTEIPAGWPLLEGRLVCRTCHDEPTCDGEPAASHGADMLRGGPWRSVAPFCSSCHHTAPKERVSPHEAMFHDGEVDDSACSYCHEGDPAEGGPVLATCLPCHEYMTPHVGSMEHMMAATGAIARIADRAATAGLPLVDGRMACVTCHDPHPPEVLEGRTKAPIRSSAPDRIQSDVIAPFFADRHDGEGRGLLPPQGRAPRLRLGLEDSRLCRACHGAGGASEGSTP